MKEILITDLLRKAHPLVEMPPLWGVIYYEGIHGNHILFTPQEVEEFESQLSNLDGERVELEDLGLELSTQVSYRDMVRFISRLSHPEKRQIFYLYKSWLKNTSEFLKVHAH